MARWSDGDREGYLACFAEDCEFNIPRRPGTGRDAVAAWWDFNVTAFGTGHLRCRALIESGGVALEGVSRQRTRPAARNRKQR